MGERLPEPNKTAGTPDRYADVLFVDVPEGTNLEDLNPEQRDALTHCQVSELVAWPYFKELINRPKVVNPE